MLAIQIWVNIRLTQSVQVQGRTKAPDGRGCCWKLVDHSHHPTSNPLFLTLLEFSQPTLHGYYRKTKARTVLHTRYYSSISWEWDQLVFHVEGKRKRQQRWSFLLALWTTNCSSESILLFILPDENLIVNWKHTTSQESSHRKTNVQQPLHHILATLNEFHSCMDVISVVMKGICRSTLENVYWVPRSAFAFTYGNRIFGRKSES